MHRTFGKNHTEYSQAVPEAEAEAEAGPGPVTEAGTRPGVTEMLSHNQRVHSRSHPTEGQTGHILVELARVGYNQAAHLPVRHNLSPRHCCNPVQWVLGSHRRHYFGLAAHCNPVVKMSIVHTRLEEQPARTQQQADYSQRRAGEHTLEQMLLAVLDYNHQ